MTQASFEETLLVVVSWNFSSLWWWWLHKTWCLFPCESMWWVYSWYNCKTWVINQIEMKNLLIYFLYKIAIYIAKLHLYYFVIKKIQIKTLVNTPISNPSADVCWTYKIKRIKLLWFFYSGMFYASLRLQLVLNWYDKQLG